MKKLLTILIIGIILNACEKQPFDYRNKFVGKYEFTTLVSTVNVLCCESNLDCCTTTSEVIYQGKITYGKEKNEIVIDYIESVRDFVPYSNTWWVSNGKLHIIVNKEGSSINFSTNGDVEFSVSYTGLSVQGTSHYVKGKKL